MKKIKWRLLIIALFGICVAYTNKTPRLSFSYHRYAFMYKTTDGSRYYISKDLTDAGWIKGINYDCIFPPSTCTFLADPIKLHSDFSGMYFFTSDIPVSGIDNSGYFENLDEP